MRIDEFASAEEQLALWRLVNDNVWQAIDAQRQPLAQPDTAAAPMTPANASTAPKDGVFAQKLVQKNSEVDGDDRHSKNGYPVNPLQKPKPLGLYRELNELGVDAVTPLRTCRFDPTLFDQPPL